MTNIIVNNSTRIFLKNFSEKSYRNALWFPVDRAIVEASLAEILSIDPVEFIFANLETGSSVWNNSLFICLPEIWYKINTDDIIDLIENFTNPLAFFTLIEFTYKYIQINIIPFVFQSDHVEKKFGKKVREFLTLQWYNLTQTKEGYDLLLNNKYWDYSPQTWSHIRQIFLIDKRVDESFHDPQNLQLYLKDYLK